MQLAIDKETGDLFKPVGGGVSRVSEGRFVAQQVQSKLATWLGEWALDKKVGWVNQADFEKNFDAFSMESRARSIILSTAGVLRINKMDSSYSNRTFTLSFSASTTYGTIDLTIPWGVQ